MESYKEFLKSEVQEFRKAGHRFLEKEISKAEFKGISGGMGVYAQQDQKSFMIRLRTTVGIDFQGTLKSDSFLCEQVWSGESTFDDETGSAAS